MTKAITTPTKPIKMPNAEHPIAITANPRRVVVTVGGTVVADTRNALTLREASYPPVHYIPREDVDMALLEASDHETYCAYKGECGYLAFRLGATARPTRSGPTRPRSQPCR